MLISPFTPLCFKTHKTDGLESSYIQIFAPYDQILVQTFRDPNIDEGNWYLYSEPDGVIVDRIIPQTWGINDDICLDFAVISPSVGNYSIKLGKYQSKPFKVTDDEKELEKTTLIQYSMKNNRQRTDAVFFIDNMQYFFDFRVPGGFKDKDWSFGVENEQFVTSLSDISQLYGLESTQKKFTLGNSKGVGIWFGEMLNRLLTCSHVYFDGVKYVRKEASTPEISQVMDGVNSFVFTQSLQQSVHLDPAIEETNHLIMRRIDNTNYRKVTDTTNRLI